MGTSMGFLMSFLDQFHSASDADGTAACPPSLGTIVETPPVHPGEFFLLCPLISTNDIDDNAVGFNTTNNISTDPRMSRIESRKQYPQSKDPRNGPTHPAAESPLSIPNPPHHVRRKPSLVEMIPLHARNASSSYLKETSSRRGETSSCPSASSSKHKKTSSRRKEVSPSPQPDSELSQEAQFDRDKVKLIDDPPGKNNEPSSEADDSHESPINTNTEPRIILEPM